MTKLNTWSIDAGYTGGSGFYLSLSKATIQVYINELKYKRESTTSSWVTPFAIMKQPRYMKHVLIKCLLLPEQESW